jgi:hypothetical protein
MDVMIIRRRLDRDQILRQTGVKDDQVRFSRMGDRTLGLLVACDLVETFWNAKFSQSRVSGNSERLLQWKPRNSSSSKEQKP